MHRWPVRFPWRSHALTLGHRFPAPVVGPAAAQDVLVAFAPHLRARCNRPPWWSVSRRSSSAVEMGPGGREGGSGGIGEGAGSVPRAMAVRRGPAPGPEDRALPTSREINRRVNTTPYRSDAQKLGSCRPVGHAGGGSPRHGGRLRGLRDRKYRRRWRACRSCRRRAMRIEVGTTMPGADYHAALTVQLGGRAWLLDMVCSTGRSRATPIFPRDIYTINEVGLWVRG